MELVLLLSAKVELQNGFERYEGYRIGLGEVFWKLVDALIHSCLKIDRNPIRGSSYTNLKID